LLKASTETLGTAGRVRLDGELGRWAGPIVIPAVQALLSEGATTIEVHTADIQTADRDGVAALVQARREALDAGAKFTLTAPSEAVRQEIERARRELRQRTSDRPGVRAT
jgi:ABC-type transporter Mla MlaB component